VLDHAYRSERDHAYRSEREVGLLWIGIEFWLSLVEQDVWDGGRGEGLLGGEVHAIGTVLRLMMNLVGRT